jgi:CRISPR-associated exonuclease Cas4
VYTEDNLIPISALQHALFCERQYALIHLEQIWEENRFTAEGRVLHERVDAEHHESRRLFRQEYGMAVRSLQWGLIGKCDLVELWFSGDTVIQRISPVEFKRGRKKESDVDRVQLCAQVFCLEEMFDITIDSGQLYYLQEHRRTNVIIDEKIRNITSELIKRTRLLWESGITPAAAYEKRKCDRCSIVDLCMPKNIGKAVGLFTQNQVRLMKKTCTVEGEPI